MGNQTTAVAAQAEKDEAGSLTDYGVFFESRVGSVRLRYGVDIHDRAINDPAMVDCLHDICHCFYSREIEGYPIHDKSYMDYAVLDICTKVSERYVGIFLGCAYMFEPFHDIEGKEGPVVYLSLYEKQPTVKSYNCFASTYN